MNTTIVAAEFVRAVRGKRSQEAMSRRLKMKSNVAYTWEAGKRWPSASKWLSVCERLGIDVAAALVRFYRAEPAWLSETRASSPEGVRRLLLDLKGNASIAELVKRSGYSRFAISRWLKGQAEPKLPEFLHLIGVLSLRLLDFVAAFVDPETLPSVRDRWRELEAARRSAYELPWSHAVLRVLETEHYRRTARHDSGWIAASLGVSEQETELCLDALLRSGQVEFIDDHYRVFEMRTIDTQEDRKQGQALKAWWARVALERLEQSAPGRFSYNLFTVSEADYERIEALHLAYFRELRAIVAGSTPAERVVLVNVQLVPLAIGSGNRNC